MQNPTRYHNWIGRQETKREVLGQRHAHIMAATLSASVPETGEQLPLPWHWGWFNDIKPMEKLGRDGHPKRGGFLPPIEFPRRMWAGGALNVHKPLLIGQEITRLSTIEDIQQKQGHSGELYIVTIRHELFDQSILCIEEKQNLVYREAPDKAAFRPARTEPPQDAMLKRAFTPDSVLLFRYSALTFNGHRIHYDVEYGRNVEGYRDLVLHAPLTATLLCQLASELAGYSIMNFDYRATAPLFCNERVILCGKVEDRQIITWAENSEGNLAMIGTVLPT